MKAVVTGGAGFIGSHLVDLLLDEGYKVTVIDNLSTGRIENLKEVLGEIALIEADLSIPEEQWLRACKEADYVYHLASLADIVPSIEDPNSYFTSNVISTLNILNAVDKKGLKKLVYAASSSCYGFAERVPTTEEAKCDPQYPYALTKYIGEQLVMHWGKVYGLPVVSNRFFNVYGTRSRTSGTYGAVFGVFLAQKLADKPMTIVGDGNQRRDFTYVTDVCEGLYLSAISKIKGEVLNIGSGNPSSINELVAELKPKSVVHIPKRPGEPDITHADITKARKLIGYSPKVSFKDGVQRVLNEIEYWSDAPVWTAESIEVATRKWFEALGGVK